MCRYTHFARCTIDCLGTEFEWHLVCNGFAEHFVLSQSILLFVFQHLAIFYGITVRVALYCTIFYCTELYYTIIIPIDRLMANCNHFKSHIATRFLRLSRALSLTCFIDAYDPSLDRL